MHSGLRYLIGFNGYPFSAVAAVVLHCLVLGFILYWNTASDSSEFELVQPTVIKSLFIDENPQLRERRRLERQQVQRQQEEEQRRLQEQQRQQEEEQQRQEEERQRQAEEERQRQQLLEQQRQQELRDQAERERLEDEERLRQEELAEQERRRQQEEAEVARLAEEAAAAAARTESQVRDSAALMIRQDLQQVWNPPPSARNGMRVVLQITMLPTGEVIDVRIAESSGDVPFDTAAENAVYRAQPFRYLQEMPINIFNANFRPLSLIFQPEDLLN